MKAKTIFANSMLVSLLVWPLLHYGLINTTDLSPWKFFGWAMYCEPTRYSTCEITGIKKNTDGLIASFALGRHKIPEKASASLAGQYKQFGELRSHLGRHVAPDNFAAALLDAYSQHSGSELQGIRITIHDIRLDSVEGRMKRQSSSNYDYWYPLLAPKAPKAPVN